MNKLLIKIPTRERGFDWLHTYLDNITNPNTQVLLTLDDDQDISDDFICELIHVYPYVIPIYEKSNNKIHAYNRDIFYADDWDILCVGSDDMIPQIKGFDQQIIDDMNKYFPDGDGCLWYDTEDQDSVPHIPGPRGSSAFLQRGICMLPVMGKKYYDRFGYVYHPSYKSFWCDNEYTDVARGLGKIQWVGKRIIKHYHPAWESDNSYGKPDELYTRNNPNFTADMNNYRMRKIKGFPK